MRPFFSVVIPTYNEQDYLPRLLTDLTKQIEKSFEVIVVDGRSTDATIEKALAFENKLTLQIIRLRKGNVSKQRNAGADKARGDYVIFFDADVQIPPTYLQKLRNQFEKTPIQYATTYLKSDSPEMADKIIAQTHNIGIELSGLIEKPFIPGFNFIIQREVFIKTKGFREDVVHGEDFEYARRLYRLGYERKVFPMPKATFSLRRYRKEGHLSVMRKNAQSTLHELFKGEITHRLFSYPMGGGWYKNIQAKPKSTLEQYYEKIKVFLSD